jgi:hypothetical protein
LPPSWVGIRRRSNASWIGTDPLMAVTCRGLLTTTHGSEPVKSFV